MNTSYIVDTSEWINLDKKYPREIFPTLWVKVEDLISEGRISSPNVVRDEIKRGHDEMVEWVETHPETFHSTDKLLTQVKKIMDEYPSLTNPDAPDEIADPHIIALAVSIMNDLDRSPVIVTDEKPQRQDRIPYAARHYGVPTCKLLGMFQREGWRI